METDILAYRYYRCVCVYLLCTRCGRKSSRLIGVCVCVCVCVCVHRIACFTAGAHQPAVLDGQYIELF